MKVLHLIRNSDDRLPEQIRRAIERIDGVEQTLVLIQDGVYAVPPSVSAYACAEDVRARGVQTDLELVDYEHIVRMIFEHDRVFTW